MTGITCGSRIRTGPRVGAVRFMLLVAALGCGLAPSAPALAQQPADTTTPGSMKLDGPRVGFTFLSSSTIANVDDPGIREDLEGFPFVSQFGWQWERRFFTTPEGSTGVTEVVLLAGAVERNIVLPSLTWLVGFRGANGAEFGVGPNVSLAGGAFVLAGGATITRGGVNFPINVALATSSSGTRLTVLMGFNVASGR